MEFGLAFRKVKVLSEALKSFVQIENVCFPEILITAMAPVPAGVESAQMVSEGL